MTQDLIPKWGTLVYTTAMSEGPPDFGDVKNALLYSDVVSVLPIECIVSEGWLAGFYSALADKGLSDKRSHPEANKAESTILSYRDFQSDLESADLANVLVMAYNPGTLLEQSPARPQIKLNTHFLEWAKHSRVVIVNGIITSQEPNWDPYVSTGRFTNAISKILLPDISTLPLEAIAEMRSRLAGCLDPMRAELLRLSEDLRKAIKDQNDVSEVSAEAEILVKTRVEPIVREAGQLATEMIQKKWRRFFQGVTRVFGLTGAAFFRPDLLKDAVKEVLDTGIALSDSADQRQPLAKTAHFVLEARRLIRQTQHKQT